MRYHKEGLTFIVGCAALMTAEADMLGFLRVEMMKKVDEEAESAKGPGMPGSIGGASVPLAVPSSRLKGCCNDIAGSDLTGGWREQKTRRCNLVVPYHLNVARETVASPIDHILVNGGHRASRNEMAARVDFDSDCRQGSSVRAITLHVSMIPSWGIVCAGRAIQSALKANRRLESRDEGRLSVPTRQSRSSEQFLVAMQYRPSSSVSLYAGRRDNARGTRQRGKFGECRQWLQLDHRPRPPAPRHSSPRVWNHHITSVQSLRA